jgi:hypothetical protein
MTRWNVELKYQTTVDAETEVEAYDFAKRELVVNMRKVFGSHCKKVK